LGHYPFYLAQTISEYRCTRRHMKVLHQLFKVRLCSFGQIHLKSH